MKMKLLILSSLFIMTTLSLSGRSFISTIIDNSNTNNSNCDSNTNPSDNNEGNNGGTNTNTSLDVYNGEPKGVRLEFIISPLDIPLISR